MEQEFSARPMVSKPGLARELDVTPRTIDRWAEDPALAFPKPVKFKRRVFFFRHEIEAWKITRARRSVLEAAE